MLQNSDRILSVSLDRISKTYGTHKALQNLSLNIPQGEIFCLLGQNGAGKTTTINILLGFLKPDSGEAYIDGTPVTTGSNLSRGKVAYIPEVVQLYPHLSGIENLDFFSRLAGHAYGWEELSALLTKAGLATMVQTKRLSHYSKGMRQKVGIAIALAKKASVILMDEPTSGLDPKATAEFTGICKELATEGRTIFMATHDIFNAVNTGSRIGIMKEGQLVHDMRNGQFSASELQEIYLETI